MPIRDRLRRALRKSDSSGSIARSDSNTITTTTTAHTSQSSEGGASAPSLQPQPTGSSVSNPRLGLVKTFTLGRDPEKTRAKEEKRQREREKKQEKVDKRHSDDRRRLHPSERPLTAQNLRHQQMLSKFTMTFGASDQAMIARPSFQEGVSPCCTRQHSFDGGWASTDSSQVSQVGTLTQGLKGVAV